MMFHTVSKYSNVFPWSAIVQKDCPPRMPHEASRSQYLVRVAGAKPRTFSYKNGSMKKAREEAESYLAKALKMK